MPEVTYPAEIASAHVAGRGALRFWFRTRGAFVWVSVLLALVLMPAYVNAVALALSGKTQLDGLEISATVHEREAGNIGEEECQVSIEFGGNRMANDVTVGEVRFIRAVDDLGENLLGTNRVNNSFEPGAWGGGHLKSPSARAKTIEIECEAELLTPTIPRLVFTNIPAHLGEPLQDALLRQYHVGMTIFDSRQRPGSDATIEWDDPDKKLMGVCLRTFDGVEARGGTGHVLQLGAKSVLSYENLRESLRDLELAVRLDVPQTRKVIQFKIGNIPLPWVQSTNLEVTATDVAGFDKFDGTNAWGTIDLAFRGGPMTNAAGIRRVWLTKVEGGAGERFDLLSYGAEDGRFARRSRLDGGGVVRKKVRLLTHSSRLRSIKVLEGNVELFCPNQSNDGFVTATSGLNRAGTDISNVSLDRRGVRIKFLDVKNFGATAQEMIRTNYAHTMISHGYQTDATQMPKNVQDSLLFSFRDRHGLVLEHEMWFFDAWGRRMDWTTECLASDQFLLQFATLPQTVEFEFYLATPESLKVVHFRVEDIALR